MKRRKGWRMSSAMTITMSSAVYLYNYELCSFSNLSVTSPTSQLILQLFRRFIYITAHAPTLPLLYLYHSSFSNPSFASPASQALHLIHLASHPWCQVEKLEHSQHTLLLFGLNHSFSFPYVSIKTPFLATSNDTG